MTEPTVEAAQDDPHEYVDLMLEFKDGKIVGCEFYGEGRQAEPITGLQFFKPIGSVETAEWPRHIERIARRLKLAFGRLSRS